MLFYISGDLKAQTASADAQKASTTPRYFGFEVDYREYLSNHDVVYLSPPKEGYEGFPLGNGDVGAMIHCTSNGFTIQVNKNDTWDQSGAEEMLLRSCGQINVDFGAPVFEWLYQNKFEARLSLYEAKALFSGSTSFADISAEANVHAGKNLFIFRNRFVAKGPLAGRGSSISVALDRWGSRAFGGWYNSISRPAGTGIGNAIAGKQNDDIYIKESFGNLDFVIAVRVLGENARRTEIINSRTAKLMLGGMDAQDFCILVSVVTSNESDQPLQRAIAILNEAEREGIEQLNVTHREWWRNFWQRSFVHIGDNYIENLYYNHFYLMASSSRGKYPAIFNGSLWTWNHDVRQWISRRHWNMQQSYWPLDAANHGDLMKPYLATYWRLLPYAEKHAKKRGYNNAILWSEKHDFSGKMISWDAYSFVNNFTPASQMAQLFWNHYQFTRNVTFLKDTAYPFMKKAASFYCQYLKYDTLGNRYYIYPSSAYESEQDNALTNASTDLATIRASFRHCIEASGILKIDLKERKRWQDILNRLSPYPLSNVRGMGEVLAVSETKGDSTNSKAWDYTFCRSTSPVFPSGDIGLSQKGSRYFNAAVNRAKLHPENTLAISPIAVVSARLGLAEDAWNHLLMSVRQLQHFPQGLFFNLDHWSYLSRYAGKFDGSFLQTQRDYIVDRSVQYKDIHAFQKGKSAEKVSTPALPFIQSGMEPSAILATTVNEMLLQSHEGIIRTFPATPFSWAAAFTLSAQGGFIVSSEKRKEDSVAAYISLKSIAGQYCSVQNPWNGLPKLWREKKGVLTPLRFKVNDNQIISFQTEKGATYLIQPDGDHYPIPLIKIYTAEKNDAPKRFHEAVIGKPRDF